MALRAILFDINGTLIDIETDEQRLRSYATISSLLRYQGIDIAAPALRARYLALDAEQRAVSREQYPEIDVVAIWQQIVDETASALAAPAPRGALAPLLAGLHRQQSRNRLRLYPGVLAVLDELAQHYTLGVVTDGQVAYARPELAELGLLDRFAPIIVSGAYGYRKPDPRLFAAALAAWQLAPSEAIYVGNDMHCDIFGAQQAGLAAIFVPTQYGAQQHPGVTPDLQIARIADLPAAVAALVATRGV